MTIKGEVLAGCIKAALCISTPVDHDAEIINQWRLVIQHDDVRARNEVYAMIKADPTEFGKHAAILQNFAVNSQESTVGKDISEELIDLSESFYPESTDDWSSSIEWGGVTVFKNNTIFDLNRSDYHLPAFQTSLYQGIEIIEADPDSVILPTYGTSGARMRIGMSPIGQDGIPIRLCRITNHPSAPLYEINHISSADLLNRLKANMTLDEACVSEAASASYWLQRYKELR